jgi:hypothetical protein
MFIDYQLVYSKLVLCTKFVWCSMMNTCLCEYVFDDIVHDIFNQFLSMCMIIIS